MYTTESDIYRDLTDAEIIKLAETHVVLSVDEHGKWSWAKRGAVWSGLVSQPTFSTKIGAADDAVCTLDLDQ
jgi:hypothetical protein